MKITVQKDILLNACQKAQKVISSKNTLPILDSIKFTVDGKSIAIEASDLETHLRTMITADDVEGDKVCFCLSSKLLVDTISKLPSIPFDLFIDDATARIETPSGQFTMPVYDANEFPLQQLGHETTFSANLVPTDELYSVVHSVLFAVSKEELRPNLCGVNIVKKDHIYFNATDTHRLTSNILDVASEGEIDTIIPIKPLRILHSLFEDKVNITYGKNLTISDGSTWITVNTLKDRYPNVFSVIPPLSETDVVFRIKQFELVKLLKLATIYSNKASSLVKFTVGENMIKIDAQDLDFSISATETYECTTNGDIVIGFNGVKLLDCISNLKCDMIEFRMTDPSRASLLLDADGISPQKTIVMPLMII